MHVASGAGGSLAREQVEFYNRNGYLVLDRLLSTQDLRPAREAAEARVEEIARELVRDGLVKDPLEGRPFEHRLAELFAGLGEKEFLRYGRSWRDRHPGYFDLMRHSKILDAVESLIGPEIFANPVYNTRPKVPGVAAGAVPWHQDKSYWPDANSNPVITVWVPLVDSTHENGCLRVVPGTHRKKLLAHHAEAITGTSYRALSEEQVGGGKVLALPVSAGSAILFNDRLLHMSTPNRARTVRWSVDLRYQPTDQDPMPRYGVGFLARSRLHPGRVATRDDWLALKPEHAP